MARGSLPQSPFLITGGQRTLEELTEELFRKFPNDKFRDMINGDWPPEAEKTWEKIPDEIVQEMEHHLSTTHLGSRVTGEGTYEYVKLTGSRGGKIKSVPDRVTIDYANSPEKEVKGFAIHLGLEKKTIYMPASEIRNSLYDRQFMEKTPQDFVKKYADRMIATARGHLQSGTLGSPEALALYERESWMTDEQAQVLASLRDEAV